MKKNQVVIRKNERAQNAKLPIDPKGRIDRLLKRIELAVQRLESAIHRNEKEQVSKNARLISELEREIYEWKQLKK